MSSRSNSSVTDGAFVCKWASCGVKFKTKTSLRSHLGTHPPQHVFLCMWESCERQFNNMAKYLSHYKIHARQTPFRCANCNETFSRRTYLKQHLYEHAIVDRMLNKPTLSNKVELKNKGKVGISVDKETRELKYQCDVNGCMKSYAFRQSLHWHKQAHHKRTQMAKLKEEEIGGKEPTAGIDAANKSQATKTNRASNHKRKSPADTEESRLAKLKRHDNGGRGYACSVAGCKSIVKLYSSLRRHLRDVHSIQLDPLQDVSQFGRHDSASSNEDSEGGLSFADRLSKVSAQLNPHLCPEPGCNKRYRRRDNLRTHQKKRHKGEEKCGAAEVGVNGAVHSAESKQIKGSVPRQMSAEELEAETLSAVASLAAISQLQVIEDSTFELNNGDYDSNASETFKHELDNADDDSDVSENSKLELNNVGDDSNVSETFKLELDNVDEDSNVSENSKLELDNVDDDSNVSANAKLELDNADDDSNVSETFKFNLVNVDNDIQVNVVGKDLAASENDVRDNESETGDISHTEREVDADKTESDEEWEGDETGMSAGDSSLSGDETGVSDEEYVSSSA